ncbi:hypothetical protein STEG23_033348, partial [Scotinomys teguina]
TVTEPDLRNNRLLDELVKSMHFARTRLLQFAFRVTTISPVSSTSKKVAVKVHNTEAIRHPVKQGNRLMDKFLVRETVSCPVCGVSIPENHINKHLDSCLTREEKKESLRSSAHKSRPKLCITCSLIVIKEKMKQHGLSTQGNKQQLIKRHQEFVHMYNAQCDALHPKSAAEIVQEIENMEKTRMRFEASKLNENVMVFTKDQTEKEIDEIHSKYRKKHQNEFQVLVDQAKKGYKKIGRMSKATMMIKDVHVPLENLSSPVTGQEDNMNFLDTVSVTNHFPRSELDSPGQSEPERPDDSSSCTDILLSSDSGSCNSSSSDIIRDLLEEEEAWEASHRNDQNREINSQQNHRTRATESSENEPRNKRNKN